MSRLSEDELRVGLEGMHAALEADGYELDATWQDDGRLTVRIRATETACADCLVPVDVMRGIVVTMLDAVGARLTEEDVDVIYPEGSAAQ